MLPGNLVFAATNVRLRLAVAQFLDSMINVLVAQRLPAFFWTAPAFMPPALSGERTRTLEPPLRIYFDHDLAEHFAGEQMLHCAAKLLYRENRVYHRRQFSLKDKIHNRQIIGL